MNRFPEVHDLVAVTIKFVDYYGYIDDIEYDIRDPRVRVEFYPGGNFWFDFAEIRLVDFPKEIK